MEQRCTCCPERARLLEMNGVWFCPLCDKLHQMPTN
jgi:hypothetical protein